ncbi:hypothetical protein TrispH2_011142 [Trichoplax sp. H2]|nr:hypothetical protein TrispH2_011142 [Trichoplax sp. H2]|eukprot:RDD37105.1 hypothetical protein TrispH2_011142 [Trichoplax sp. H2]
MLPSNRRQATRMQGKKQKCCYLEQHQLLYGFQGQERNDQSGEIERAVCLFCLHFGRENGSKKLPACKRKNENPFTTTAFDSHHYLQHLTSDHPIRWSQFEKASDKEKYTFFGQAQPAENSQRIKRLDGRTQVPLRITFSKAVIQDIMIDLILNDTIHGEHLDSKVEPFKIYAADGKKQDCKYGAVIRNPFQLTFFPSYLKSLLSFNQIADVLTATTQITGYQSIGHCSKEKVPILARVICAHSLQMLSSIISKSWAFTICLDVSNIIYRATKASYLEILLRCYVEGSIRSFHIMFIAKDGNKGTGLIYEMILKLFNALCPHWRYTLMNVVHESRKKSANNLSRLMERILLESKRKPFKVWRCPHLFNQFIAEYLRNGVSQSFYNDFKALLRYLQDNNQLPAIDEIESNPSELSDKTWKNFKQSMIVFSQHQSSILQYLQEKKPSCAPTSNWWILYFVLHHVITLAGQTYDNLAGISVTTAQQEDYLEQLLASYRKDFQVLGPLTEADRQQLDLSKYAFSTDSQYATSLEHAFEFVKEVNVITIDHLQHIPVNERKDLIMSIAVIGTAAVQCISDLISSPNEKKNIDFDARLLLLPHQLVKLTANEFSVIIRSQYDSLRYGFTDHEINEIEQDHQQLLLANKLEPTLKMALAECNHSTSFSDCWRTVNGRFLSLQRFAGEMATAYYVATAIEESPLSVGSAEKVCNHTDSLFYWEAVMHSKQYKYLQIVVEDYL